MELDIQVDLRGLKKGMSSIFKKQLPFATAQALTMTAGAVGVAWQQEMRSKLDRPTPFTLNSVAVLPARKSNLVATVLLKDVAAAYLEPFVDGGPHALGGKKGMLTPKAVPLNQYGNLSRRKIAALKADKDVFVGPVRLKSGMVVSGVWKRGQRGERRKGGYGTKGSHNIKNNEAMGLKGYNNRTTLKLLVRFTDPEPVRQRLDFKGRAEAAVRKTFEPNFTKAFAAAMASAR